jgi:hypothetical protein
MLLQQQQQQQQPRLAVKNKLWGSLGLAFSAKPIQASHIAATKR